MIAWVDVETTGLEEREGDLLEVAIVLTDDDLREIADRNLIVQPTRMSLDCVIGFMDPNVREMHTKNGLIADLHRGYGLQKYEVQTHLIDWLSASALPDKTPLAGSTVAFDRRWLRHHMPKLEALFSYRSIDVSSLTELAKRWAPAIYEGRPKAKPEEVVHRALADVRESIAILRYYRESGFIGWTP